MAGKGTADALSHSIDHYSTATEMRAALRSKAVSARELAELHIARIEAKDGELNAIPVRTFQRARAAADAADAAIARGDEAPLLGVPMTLKESTLTAGLPQSAGIPDFAKHVPTVDGPLAKAVFAAGACLLGKTNIPVALGDWQADSPVYGRTNNPWDPSRTPGGSTGGGGAALAAGMTPLEVGSDIGGSIRVPAAYCGVFGHRPSETAIPRTGAFPLADVPNPMAILGVQGPLARSAADLELLFDVLVGPEAGEDVAWRLQLPPPRHTKLGDFRVAVLPETSVSVPPSSAMHGALAETVALLRSEGASVDEAGPDVDWTAYLHDYYRLLMAMISLGQPREEREANAASLRASGDPAMAAQADGMTMDFAEMMQVCARRERVRMAWRDFFEDRDLVLAPMTLDAAFEHQTGAFAERTITIDNRTVPYGANLLQPMIAIFPGLPSTAFPAGLDPRGLPLGLQAIGPYLEDRTPLRFAQLLEAAGHAFRAPPGY
ncbi:MAG TPA: amidase family protein [Pseudomonadales bacterium]|nr:amidase family protein [Pseudomonadales bacterium]